MKPTFEIPAKDLALFRRDLSKLANGSTRVATDVINSKAWTITKLAEENTKRASREEIESLGLRTLPGSVKEYTTSSGRKRTSRKFVLERDEAIGNYMASLIHHMGGAAANNYMRTKFSNRGQIQFAARRWIAKKLRSRGFLASTWKKALRGFDKYKTQKGMSGQFKGGPLGTGRPNVNINGYGIPAKGGLRPTATIANIVGSDYWGKPFGEKPKALLLLAFRKAFYAELREGARHLEERMKKMARAMGVTVR